MEQKKRDNSGSNNPMYGRKHTDEARKKQSQAVRKKYPPKPEGFGIGEKNGMFGKSVYERWVELYGENIAKEKLKIQGEKISKANTGNKNRKDPIYKNGVHPRIGKNNYQCWLEKYGKEEADRRQESYVKKQSENSKGSNNAMYGKSPAHSAGLGYAGKYKGWYFRSILELSYMIKVIEKYNIDWERGELHKFRCFYKKENGLEATYAPDFVINGKYVIEIKPKFAVKYNEYKFEKARNFFKEKDMKFKVTRCSLINSKVLIEMYNKGVVVFNKPSEERFLKYFKLKENK
jgi:hypothetical protein